MGGLELADVVPDGAEVEVFTSGDVGHGGARVILDVPVDLVPDLVVPGRPQLADDDRPELENQRQRSRCYHGNLGDLGELDPQGQLPESDRAVGAAGIAYRIRRGMFHYNVVPLAIDHVVRAVVVISIVLGGNSGRECDGEGRE